MRIGSWDTADRPLIVAEIGNNHEGCFPRAVELIHRAAEAGAGAVKFQTFCTEHYVSRADRSRYDRLESFRLSCDEFARLSEVAAQAGVMFLSTPFDLHSVRFLNDFVPAFKVSSGDNSFYPLLEAVADTGKPILLSTGLIGAEQIAWSAACIQRRWHHASHAGQLALLHCVSSYPVPPPQANLGAIPALKHRFGHTVGYSDHTLGIEACVTAAALGARIIEKHFTLDKHLSDFRDHQLSADPAELALLVERVDHVVTLLGSGRLAPMPCEHAGGASMRRSIAAARDLRPGTVLRGEDLTWVRPGGGLAPGEEHRLLGQTLAVSVNQGAPITTQHLDRDPARATDRRVTPTPTADASTP